MGGGGRRLKHTIQKRKILGPHPLNYYVVV